MGEYAYEKLSALDKSFLAFEGPDTHMHVAATAVFDAGPLAKTDGGVDIQRVRRYIESRLHLIPRYRQRLAYVPIQGDPVWIDDARFNILYHVRHTSLPRPGDERQLKRLAARILSQQLDRGKPLWEIWIVEGLGEGRFAMVSKTHHCMIDGISGVDILSVLLDVQPGAEAPPSPPWFPKTPPGRLELLREQSVRLLREPLDAAARMMSDPGAALAEIRDGLEGAAEALHSALETCSETVFNHPIGPHRRFSWTVFDLAEVREVKNRLGGSVNDVVLATVAGAVRRFLERRRFKMNAINFRAFVPVSVRSAAERGTLGNRVTGWTTRLPIEEADPRTRLAKVQETTAMLKESKQALGAEVLTRATNWTPSTVLSLAARLSTRLLPFNLVVTNVPGPQIPLYLLGARLREIYPEVPLFYNQGLGIALFSYDGKLFWGLTADWDLMPDLADFASDLDAAFAELRALPAETPAAQEKKQRRGRAAGRAGAPRRSTNRNARPGYA